MKSNINLHRPQRHGITLLITISMIALFLLMGTAFVIVANDFFKSSVRRGRMSTNVVDADGLLDQAFYMAYRGPSLDNVNSPLRGHGWLEDMYGYGFSGNLTGAAAFNDTAGNSPMITLNALGSFTQIRDRGTFDVSNTAYVDGIWIGRVITFVSGPAQGYSTRIVSHARIGSGAASSLQIIIPRDESGIDWSTVGINGDSFIVNGREFSGFGAGTVANRSGASSDAAAVARLGLDSLRPNQVGVPRSQLAPPSIDPPAAPATGYLSQNQGPNEPYDLPDFQNMLLSGVDAMGNIIPSGHRDALYNFVSGSASTKRQLTMRPVYIANDDGSTANADFEGTFGTANNMNSLEVDNDGDGVNDSVWIDIGLPIQTDDQGRKFRPLVAYHIVDMDGRLNLNAHGMNADLATGSANRQGGGYGVAEISLSGVTGSEYGNLLGLRYGADSVPGNVSNALSANYSVGQKLFGHPVPNALSGFLFGTGADFYASTSLAMPFGNTDQFPEFVGGTPITGLNNSVNPYLSDFSLGGGVGDSHIQPFELESILRQHDVDSNMVATRFSDALRSQLRNEAGKVTTDSYEVAIPAATRSVLELLRERVFNSVGTADANEVFRIFIGADPIPGGGGRTLQLISKEMLMGGRFDLNRPLGNGVDDDRDGVVDDSEEVGSRRQISPQHKTPEFNLDNGSDAVPRTGDSLAKSQMANQLYILALLTCGDDVSTLPEAYPPTPDPPGPNAALTAVESYRRSVAQWAVNVVDYRDPDSIMTVFEYDVNPFNDPRIPANIVDGNPFTDEAAERDIVYGVERPELLITETLAHHDRQLTDTSTEVDNNNNGSNGVGGEDVAGGDSDFDSARVPQSSAFIELYHPHLQTYGGPNGFQVLPNELINETDFSSPPVTNDGVELNKRAPDNTPVWRILVRRGPNTRVPADANEPVRSIFFVDPTGSPAPIVGDSFFPSGSFGPVSPGEYAVIGSPGNVAGRDMVTFGRLNGVAGVPTMSDINETRSIELRNGQVIVRDWDVGAGAVVAQPARACETIIVDRSVSGGVPSARGLSLSDRNGGYPFSNFDAETDGILLTNGGFPPVPQARDTPYDADLESSVYHDEDDIDAIWTNGVKRDGNYQFRVLHLQRLADPTSAFDLHANPYVTIDVANVDLLAFNGLENNPQNRASATTETGLTPAGDVLSPIEGPTQLGGIERGESVEAQYSKAVARRQLFRIGERDANFTMDTGHQAGDGHNFSYNFFNGGERLETLGIRNEAYNDTTQFGWLAWNNRPYANSMEIANVPMLSSEGIVRHFSVVDADVPAIGTEAEPDQAFSYFFGDDQFAHLPGFGGVLRNGVFAPNRFDRLLEFIEVPNRFLGSETFLDAPVARAGALLFNLNPPFHSIPNFRYPGRVNLNTIYHQDVWDALIRGFGNAGPGGVAGGSGFSNFRADRSRTIGPTDFGGLYTTAEGAEFVPGSVPLRKGSAAGLFRRNGTGGAAPLSLDSANDITIGAGTDVGSAAFRNETRTRLGNAMTTRSSVFAFWITIGYFEVDEYGRVGAEIGSDEGLAKRNRAFYMVDRSIPVACEPGRNHNVDDSVLVRTIIE